MVTREDLRHLRCSRHALDTMRRRDISPEEVADVLLRPQVVEPHRGRYRYVRDGLTVVLAKDLTIITVLLRSGSQWTDADARNR